MLNPKYQASLNLSFVQLNSNDRSDSQTLKKSETEVL